MMRTVVALAVCVSAGAAARFAGSSRQSAGAVASAAAPTTAVALRTEISRYDNGVIREQRTYRGTRSEGTHRGWHDNGEKRFEAEYRDGVMDGTMRMWSRTGQLVAEHHYRAGQEAGTQRLWNDDGSVRANYVVQGGRRFGLIGAVGCQGESAEPLPFYRSAAMTPEWLSAREAASATTHRVGAFRMRDQHGVTVTDTLLRGHVTLVQFFFATCGDVCPLTTRNIVRVLDTLRGARDVRVLSYSITPERDSTPVLAEFAATRGIRDPRWHLLSSTRADVERLARESYFVQLGDTTGYAARRVPHTETLFLIDGEGRIRGVYPGTLAIEVPHIVEDVRALVPTLTSRPSSR